MRAAALALTYGRAEVAELLACWARQTVTVPLVLWHDGATSARLGNLPEHVHVHVGPRLGNLESIGPARAAAVTYARDLLRLTGDDALLLLDDDDYYHPRHAELTLMTLRSASWTGARRIGLQREPGGTPVLLEGLHGPGQHATWAMRLSTYDAAGGYSAARLEDVDLGQRIGWRRCIAHGWCTHVRRQHSTGLSLDFDRDSLRARTRFAPTIEAKHTPELEQLEQWCTAHLSPW